MIWALGLVTVLLVDLIFKTSDLKCKALKIAFQKRQRLGWGSGDVEKIIPNTFFPVLQ